MIIPSTAYVHDVIQYQAVVRGGIPGYKYHWDFGDDTNSTHQQPTHQYINTGHYPVILQVTDSNNTTVSTSKTIMIHLKDTTPPQINLTTPGRYIYVKGIPIIRFFRPIIFGKINISFNVTDNHSDILFIRLFINDILMESWTQSPISWHWTTREYGKRIIKIEAYDTSGNIHTLETTIWKFF
jgi:PKD repeat protein